jgi:sensor histidine kinase YesM
MNFFWKYIFPGIFGLIIYTTIRLVNDLPAKARFWERPLWVNAIEILFVFLAAYIINYMLNYFIRRFASDKSRTINGKTILKEFATVLLWLFIIINLTITPMAALTDDGLGWNDVAIIHIIPGLYVLLYFAIVRGNNYLKDYVQQKIRLEKIENDHLQTELKFLKAQYHPHFLFNALNTIYFQMDENIKAAKESIEQFSDLLRYQLYNQHQLVPISRELDYLESYIDLQRKRTSDKLSLTTKFDSRLTEQFVYPLLFLPLVENAFKYVGGKYQIGIEAVLVDKKIRFEAINSLPAEIASSSESGIGLENLKRRLELLYPNKHELVLRKNENSFVAILEIEANQQANES